MRELKTLRELKTPTTLLPIVKVVAGPLEEKSLLIG
jgi:hypothetical protein